MSELLHHRDTEANKSMVELMTTVQDFTLVVTTVVAQTAAVPSRPPQMPEALNSAKLPSTRAFPFQQPSYMKVAQRFKATQPEQAKQLKLQPPAMYKSRKEVRP